MYAAVRGRTAVVLLLLSKGAKIDLVSSNGETALDRAAGAGETDVVRILAEKGANIETGEPIIDAAAAGHFEVVSLLITKGANVNVDDTAGETILGYAAREGAPLHVVRQIVSAGADMTHKDKASKTAAILATEHGHYEIADFLQNSSTK
jgi:ankyrin repeat protein